jgi:hypothetical protein
MEDRPKRKDQNTERQNPSNPMEQPEREPYRDPKRPFDPQIDREGIGDVERGGRRR